MSAKTSRAWPQMQRAGHFCVNLLSHDQLELSNMNRIRAGAARVTMAISLSVYVSCVATSCFSLRLAFCTLALSRNVIATVRGGTMNPYSLRKTLRALEIARIGLRDSVPEVQAHLLDNFVMTS